MRHEGYDTSEVATFLHAVADELRAMQIQLELVRTPASDSLASSQTTATSPIVGIAEVAPQFPNANDPLESELTLDALQDAQADLVARVTSTARDLHESLESGGPVTSPNHLRTGAALGMSSAPTSSGQTSSQPLAARTPASPEPTSTRIAQTPPPPPPAPLPEIDLDSDHLQEASNALDTVLDDVMGSIRPER